MWVVASVAIHGLFVFYVWNKFSLSSSAPQMTEVSVELVTPSPAEAKSATVESSPLRTTQAKVAPELMLEDTKVSDSPIDFTQNQVAIAEQMAKKSNDERVVLAEADPQLAPETIRQVEASSGTEDKIRKHELVRSRLEAHKFYPASARRRSIEGEVELGFALNSKGLADSVMILAGSGYSILDRAAMQTVHRAQPFPIFDGEYRVRLRFRRL